MTPPLRKYLELERLMLILDEEGDAAAETLRDAIDPIWYALTDEERRLLDDRRIGRIRSPLWPSTWEIESSWRTEHVFIRRPQRRDLPVFGAG